MSPKAFMMYAAGNIPAAMYLGRKSRCRSRYIKENESEKAEIGYGQNPNTYLTGLEPLKTFVPTYYVRGKIINLLTGLRDPAILSTCKVGICTADGLVAWSPHTKVDIRSDRTIFTGTFAGLPVGTCFSKVVLVMQNGDEVGRKELDHSIQIVEDIAAVITNYTIRFR